MKKPIFWLLTLVLALSLCLCACGQTQEAPAPAEEEETPAAAAEAEGVVLDFRTTGFTFTEPDSFSHTLGKVHDEPGDMGECPSYGSGILMGYLVYTARSPEEYAEMNAYFEEYMETHDDIDDEYMAKVKEFYRNMSVFYVFGLTDDWTIQTACLEALGGEPPFKDPIELGKQGDFTYYLCTFDYTAPIMKELMEGWPQEMLDEVIALSEEVEAHPELFTLKEREVDFVPPDIGTKVEFETTDLDGNPVSSEEIFAENDVTMINIWRTWCGPCVEEMPDLDELNQAYADKGAAVITYCADADSDELIAAAKDIVGEYGFQSLAWSESIDTALPWRGTPTTYFVDREGKILGYPINGMAVDEYSARLDDYLNGKEAEQSVSLVPEEGETAAYTVTVTDQNGDPVPGVYVNFCTSVACNMAISDDNGVINFEGPATMYHVDVLKVPEGYSYEAESDIYTDDDSYSMSITLVKN